MRVLLLLSILFISCNAQSDSKESEYGLKCEDTVIDFYLIVERCENKEVVCYITSGGKSSQCKFKEN